ncbi:MAG: DUF3857 domain-containing protein, partial [Bacteroidota bacterium]
MHFKKYSLFIFIICLSFAALGQKKVKWGKYSDEILMVYGSELAEGAEALILYEQGNLSYEYEAFVTKTHKRLIILEKEGISRGEFSISFNPAIEKVSDIEGITTNITNGQRTSTKLKASGIKRKVISRNEEVITIKMPAVVKGSIIEYRFEKRSKYLERPEDWSFQHDIPTLYSAYSHENLPRTFDYVTSLQGRLLSQKYTNVGLPLYELSEIPSLNDSIDYLPHPRDYAEKIIFRSAADNKINSWPKYVKSYLENQQVDRVVSEGQGMMKLTLEKIGVNKSDELLQNAKLIYRQLQQTLNWSGEHSIYPNGSNNSAEINLSLYTLLRELNSNTFIVLLSTPANGK